MKREELAVLRAAIAEAAKSGQRLGGYDANALRILFLEQTCLALAQHLLDRMPGKDT